MWIIHERARLAARMGADDTSQAVGYSPRMARGAAASSGARGRRYTPPTQISVVEGKDAGFLGSYLLRVPYLYAAGDLSLLQQPAVAIVGSRGASPEGQKRAAQLARALVRDSVVVMSGLALGIDQAAHRATIEAGGKAIGVIGTPLDRAYPRENADLQELLWRNHLLLSPFPIGTRTFPSHFPERNRVMARLSRATVIIEAGETSGTLHQAVECVALHRPLFISKSVVEDPKLKWPARFIQEPETYVLETSSDVLDRVIR